MVPVGLWWIVLVRFVVVAAMITIIIRLVQSRRRERESTGRWAMLSRVSAGLAEILHADTKLEDVLRLLVPQFADWCSVHLLEEDGVRRAAVVHFDPAIEARVRRRLSEVPFVADAPLGPAKAIRTGEPDLLQSAQEHQILAGQVDPELLEMAGIGSRISVPLRARQQVVGALSLHRRATGAYDAHDLQWAEELARQVALAIENTRLYANARSLFEESASANWVTTADGRILACNQMFAQLLGFSSMDDVLRTPAVELYATIAEREQLLAELKSQRRLSGRETSFKRHDDGRTVFALVHAFGDFDDQGELRKVTGFIVDRTAQKELEEQLRQSQRLEAVGQLAGGIAHDFNNLLTVIIGCADLMAMDGDRPAVEGDHDPLDELTKAARRAASLTQQLLAFSRRQILQPRILNLNDSLRSVHAMLRRLVRENVVIVLNLDPRVSKVKVDPGQIDQVIVNLVLNSSYAMPEGGTISLSTANIDVEEGMAGGRPYIRPGQYVSLVVRDNGAGMDEKTRERAFEPFFTTKPVGKGSGLGLSTVYGIIKQSGGYVWIDSEVDVGTSVTICFQAEPEMARV
ncbi:MAG TPA: ATP-binding protein [Vicinamibacterales bacterium]|nr:ATP-binding protein [Vicinamibacterales bacterium]